MHLSVSQSLELMRQRCGTLPFSVTVNRFPSFPYTPHTDLMVNYEFLLKNLLLSVSNTKIPFHSIVLSDNESETWR